MVSEETPLIDHESIGSEVNNDPEAEAFVQKYGEIQVSFFEPPHKFNPFFTKPYALNYFHNKKLYRTKHERTSAKLELLLDLIYVGIVSNLASSAIEGHDWYSIIKYVLVFLPNFTIWSDIKEMINYYYSGDLVQITFVIWQVILLVFYNSNCQFIDSEDKSLAYNSLLVCVSCYSLGRISFAFLLSFYSLYIKEHCLQMRIFSVGLLFTCSSWFLIFLIDDIKHKAIFAAVMIIFEQILFCFSVHPSMKKLFKLEYSTALNIEHEDERYHAFYILSIGEFLYGICAGSPLKFGFNEKLSKGVALVLISFLYMGLYTQKDGSFRAVHALRRSANAAMVFIYGHLILIATMLIVGDSGADLVKIETKYLEPEEFGILLYFHSAILISLIGLLLVAYSDKDLTSRGQVRFNRYQRTSLRIPVGLIIFSSTWFYEKIPLTIHIWVDFLLLFAVFSFEFYMQFRR